ncbi:acyltransferase domain-containing protein [Streptomyces triticagri]|uniref:Acyltransferase domain-containing protein n=1 Tax=Streptomyces triticagri TaxID=2293568 RepID=A0A372M192_9ACTN|nr:acyltransferase domain-containing protein [Streptomyces triticagri]RFU84706.1 acyltransferase domain-containing protein [Streptomyces triticagri]
MNSPDGKRLLTLAAPDEGALERLAADTVRLLRQLDPEHPAELCAAELSVAEPAAVTGAAGSHRLAVAGRSAAELSGRLAAHLAGERLREVFAGVVPQDRVPRTAFLCSGQGGQFAAMGWALHRSDRAYRRAFDRCAEIADPYVDVPLGRLVDPAEGHGPAALHRLPNAALATFAVGYALAELWRERGVEPDLVLGFTSGEYLAACLAGALTLQDALALLATETSLAARVAHGAMAVVGADETRIAHFLAENAEYGEVGISAVISPGEVSLSGDARQLAALTAKLEAQGVRTSALPVPHGLHSPLQEPFLDELRAKAAHTRVSRPRVPLISTVTGKQADAATLADPGHWAAHMRGPARFLDAARTLDALGATVCLEVGPGRALTGLGARCLPGGRQSWVASLGRSVQGTEAVLRAQGRLFASGVPRRR